MVAGSLERFLARSVRSKDLGNTVALRRVVDDGHAIVVAAGRNPQYDVAVIARHAVDVLDNQSRIGMYVATPVQLALSIYLDALNIFLALLQIFGGGRRRS